MEKYNVSKNKKPARRGPSVLEVPTVQDPPTICVTCLVQPFCLHTHRTQPTRHPW